MTSSEDSESASSENVLVFQENQKEWLLESEGNYFKQNYSACLECIKNLQHSIKKKPIGNQKQQNFMLDSKIAMNYALCELAASSFRNHEALKKELRRILKEQEAFCSDSAESAQKTHLDDLQLSFVNYNLAVLYFYNKEYGKSLKIIEDIHNSFNELIDEKLSRQITMLYVELLLETNQPLEALSVIQSLEKAIAKKRLQSNGTAPKNTKPDKEKLLEEELNRCQQLVSIFKLKCYSSLNSTKFNEKEFQQLTDTKVKSETTSNFKSKSEFQSRNYSECLKLIIVEMQKNLTEACTISGNANANLVQQLTSLSSATANLNLSVTTATAANSTNDFLFYLLKTTQNLTNLFETLTELTADSKKQGAAGNETVRAIQSLTAVFLNNIALVHHSIDKFNLSSLYFQRALTENAKFMTKYLVDSKAGETKSSKNGAKKNSDESNGATPSYLSSLMMNRHYEILFNLGLSLLFSKQPVAAFDCLFKATKVFGQNARLWLRLAECCLMCYRHSIEPAASSASDSSTNNMPESTFTMSNNEKIFKLSEKIKCVQSSFGTGFHHKIQFGTGLNTEPKETKLSLADMDAESQTAKLITLQFAYACLRNALKLIPSNIEIALLIKNRKSSSSHFLTKSSSNLDDVLESADALLDAEDENSVLNSEDQINEAIQAANVDTSELSPKSLSKSKQAGPYYFDCVWPSKPIGLKELQALRSSILVSLSYVSLCVKDYANTVKYCKSLLSDTDFLNAKFPVSNGNNMNEIEDDTIEPYHLIVTLWDRVFDHNPNLWYLAHFYIAEALLYSDKLNESIDHLNLNTRLDSESDLSFSIVQNEPSVEASSTSADGVISASTEERPKIKDKKSASSANKWYPKDLSSAKAVAFYNMSVIHAVRGEIDLAYRNFNLSVNLFEKQPAYTYFMKLYLDLLDGYRQSIQVVLKENFGHVTTSHNLYKSIQAMAAAAAAAASSTQKQMNPIQQLQQHLQQQQQLQQQLHLQQQQQLQQLQQYQSNQAPSQVAAAALSQQQLQLQQLQLQQLQHQLQQHQNLNNNGANLFSSLAAAAAATTSNGNSSNASQSLSNNSPFQGAPNQPLLQLQQQQQQTPPFLAPNRIS